MDGTPPPDDNSLGHLFSRLIDDAEQFVRAEVSLYRAQIFARIGDAKVAIVLGGLAFLIAQSSIIALLVGLVLVVRRSVHSAAGATAIVVGGALLVAGIMVAIAVAKVKKITRIRDGFE
ncbi:MAG: phage holin family protein [Sphingomonas sp.]